ncbi:SusC/RagA family TonB-linked outer membrane protein [Segetibacter sp. 3557_3]|uniref:SusC/RagA family TonB-linked outer membrane protein n=1 Tax=Segetibacter sp. 3557_3 TaxID=2547429 RepID=UPI001058D66B|nr:SusC/RagA family TonB-linked outer membrane protein [Segetibacter sp. 3557_3]TDH21309.1 SusC/RagA family TonB-linked outer membrane protein [Segetibacter sp. 3557_3]
MRKIVSLATMLLLCTVITYAQTRVVKGTVTTQDNGTPLSGVSILVPGSNVGTQTNASGAFSLNVPASAKTLNFSSVGYVNQTATIDAGGTVNITMQASGRQLDEVIVAAAGIRTRVREQGYNSTTIKNEALVAAKPVTIAAGLQGKVPGLMISGTSGGVNPNYRVVLRGMRSLTGNNEALIVLDNVIVPNAVLSNLNPEDVADVTVLNGSSAAALYGSEASNGAILVTTKKGSKGRTAIRVSQTVTTEQVAFYPKLNTRFGSGSDNDVQVYTAWENQQYGPAYDGVARDLGIPLADGSIQKVPYMNTNEKKKFWETGVTNQSDFSISSGTERSTIYLSGQYAGVKGTTPGDKYNRTSLRLNGTNKIVNNLDLTYTAGYTQNRYNITTQTSSIYNNLLNTPGQAPLTQYKDWRNNPFANPNGYYNDYYNNPYFLADNYRQVNRNDYFVGSADLKFTPLSWLDFTYRIGISTRNQSYSNTSDIFRYSDYTKGTTTGTYKKTDVVGDVEDGASYSTRINSDFQIGIRQNLNDFNFRLTAGGSLRQDESKNMSASVNGLVIPGLFNLGNSTNTPSANESNFQARQLGVYGDLNIGYKNFLFLHATGRNDFVSTLLPENRSFFYPSVDVSFIPAEALPFLNNIEEINLLKLRGGWSKVGQVNLGGNFGAYRLDPTFNQGAGFPYNGQGGFSVGNQVVSKNLKPEITTGWEGGFDLTMLKQRVVANFTWYSTKTKDQTVATGISSTSGYSTYLVNTGLTSSKGIESALHITPIRSKSWEVTVGGNYTYNDNKVISISNDLPRLSLGTYGSGAGSYAVAGQPFPVLMGTTHRRDPQGRIIVDRVTGYPSATDTISILGSATPKHILGTDLVVRFKGFRFSALAEYRGGHFIYNAGGSTFDFSGSSYNSTVFNRDRFVMPNSSYEDPANKGTYVANTNVTVRDGGPGYWTIAGPRTGIHENYLTSAAFWKLREVTLSYDIPLSLLSRIHFIKAATFSLQGRNLLILLPESNVYTDPEYSDGNGSSSGNAIGLTNLGQTPPSRYYGATLSITF